MSYQDVAVYASEFQVLDRLRVAKFLNCMHQRTIRGPIAWGSSELISPGELSMGRSGDFEVAIEEGASVVRVGQAILGARSTPDSYYWPI